MSNKLHIQTVEVRHLRESNRGSCGFLIFDDLSCFNALGYASEAELPATLGDLVAELEAGGLTEVLEVIEAHAAAGNDLWLDGEQTPNENVRRALAHASPAKSHAAA